MSFYCKKCKLDQDLPFFKKNQFTFSTKCRRCRTELIRHADNPRTDPYYRESKKIMVQRHELEKDLVQYGDPRFKLLYKEQWEKFEQQKKDYEDAQEFKRIEFERQRDGLAQRYERKIFEKLGESMV